MNNGPPKSREELAAIRRGAAREYVADQLRRASSGLNAAVDGETNSTRVAVLHGMRRKVVAMIAELRAL
jgi:hypothetical protein